MKAHLLRNVGKGPRQFHQGRAGFLLAGCLLSHGWMTTGASALFLFGSRVRAEGLLTKGDPSHPVDWTFQSVTDPLPSECPTGTLAKIKRCDRLLDHVLCNQCIDDKNDAFAEGKGLDWIPDNCSECRTVRRFYEQTVSYREWQEPLMYVDDEPHTMWAWNPCPRININKAFFIS